MTLKFELRIGGAFAAATILLGLTFPALAQPRTTTDAPQFEIADVRPSPPRIHTVMHGGMSRGDRYFVKDATLVDLIAASYRVDPGKSSALRGSGSIISIYSPKPPPVPRTTPQG